MISTQESFPPRAKYYNNYHSARNPLDSLQISIEKFQLSYIRGAIGAIIAVSGENTIPSTTLGIDPEEKEKSKIPSIT